MEKKLKKVYPILTTVDKAQIDGQNIYKKGEGNLKLPITGAEENCVIINP